MINKLVVFRIMGGYLWHDLGRTLRLGWYLRQYLREQSEHCSFKVGYTFILCGFNVKIC